MEVLARWLIQQPLHILLIAVVHFVAWALLRVTAIGRVPRANVFWVPATLWFAYAAWEWAIVVFSPEADIRVDLLLLWPVLALATIWALARAAIGWHSARRNPR